MDIIFYYIYMIVITFIDLKHMIIPDSLNIGLLILGLIYRIFRYNIYNIPINIINSILALIVPSGVFMLIILISKGGMGGGDMKLIGVLGFILGLKEITLTMFLSFLLGAIISIFLLLFNIKGKKDPIPFGPFICLAFMITVFWGDKLRLWYMKKF